MNRRRALLLLAAVGAGAALPRLGLTRSGQTTPAFHPRKDISMFKDAVEARAETVRLLISEGGINPPVTMAEVERILSHLAPQLWIGPAAGDGSALGATRLGGAPDLPESMAWPIRPIPHEAEKTAAKLKKAFAWIARLVPREIPYEFLAQISLVEAGSFAALLNLPTEGRLLFFWDGSCSIMFEAPMWCRVIWSCSDVADLQRIPVLAMMDELEKADDPSGKYTKPNVYPTRPMRLAPVYQLPHAHSCDLLADEQLAA